MFHFCNLCGIIFLFVDRRLLVLKYCWPCLGDVVYLICYDDKQSDGWKLGYHMLVLLDVLMCIVVQSRNSGINLNKKIQYQENLLQAAFVLQSLRKIVL